jgi:deazaflavin-dependent oxidoreductase (nitroreductase family)
VLVRLSIWLNPIIAPILRSPLHWLLSTGLMLITVTGRKTGRRYTIPVGYHEAPDAIIVMVGEAPTKKWWRNYLDAGPIEVELRGQRRLGRAQVLPPTSKEFRVRAEASFRRARLIPWIFGIDFDDRTGLTPAQVAQLGRQAAIVRITLE